MTNFRLNSSTPLRADLLLVAFLIGLDVVARFLPHAPNFSPVMATILFAAVVLRLRSLALLIPLIAMPVGDLIIGFDHWPIAAVVYASMLVPYAAGVLASRARLSRSVAPAMLSSSLLFFVTTNFAVWAFGTLYSHDLAGLIECYTLALPFLKYTMTGDLLWTAGLFGGAFLVQCFAAQPAATAS